MKRLSPVLLLLACGRANNGAQPARDAPAIQQTDAPAIAMIDAASSIDAAACPRSATLMPGDVTRTITIGGIARTYDVHVPPSYDATKPLPVVIDLAPLGVTAALWKLATAWSSEADKQGFIAVWPDGYQQSWNAGRCCDPAMSTVDDVAFVRALIGDLEQAACVDQKRIYATGCSNGGGMAYKLACDAADVIAAVAPVDFDCITGSANTPSCGGCTPSRPITELQVRGLLDTDAPYAGGPTSVVAGLVFPGAQANFETWGTINGCTGTPVAGSANADCQTYPACAGGVETTLCTNPTGLHCLGYATFPIVDVAWTTLSSHALP